MVPPSNSLPIAQLEFRCGAELRDDAGDLRFAARPLLLLIVGGHAEPHHDQPVRGHRDRPLAVVAVAAEGMLAAVAVDPPVCPVCQTRKGVGVSLRLMESRREVGSEPGSTPCAHSHFGPPSSSSGAEIVQAYSAQPSGKTRTPPQTPPSR